MCIHGKYSNSTDIYGVKFNGLPSLSTHCSHISFSHGPTESGLCMQCQAFAQHLFTCHSPPTPATSTHTFLCIYIYTPFLKNKQGHTIL